MDRPAPASHAQQDSFSLVRRRILGLRGKSMEAADGYAVLEVNDDASREETIILSEVMRRLVMSGEIAGIEHVEVLDPNSRLVFEVDRERLMRSRGLADDALMPGIDSAGIELTPFAPMITGGGLLETPVVILDKIMRKQETQAIKVPVQRMIQELDDLRTELAVGWKELTLSEKHTPPEDPAEESDMVALRESFGISDEVPMGRKGYKLLVKIFPPYTSEALLSAYDMYGGSYCFIERREDEAGVASELLKMRLLTSMSETRHLTWKPEIRMAMVMREDELARAHKNFGITNTVKGKLL